MLTLLRNIKGEDMHFMSTNSRLNISWFQGQAQHNRVTGIMTELTICGKTAETVSYFWCRYFKRLFILLCILYIIRLAAVHSVSVRAAAAESAQCLFQGKCLSESMNYG